METATKTNIFTDVIFLTNQGRMPYEIKRLLKHGKLSFLLLPLGEFGKVQDRLNLVGTVIIDTQGLGSLQQHKLPRIIETLEREGVGTIVLGDHHELPVKSFVLARAPVRSFALTNKTESISIDDLWVRISLNLAYRKKHSEIIVKPATPPKEAPETGTAPLSEQLCMTETLVDNLAEQLRLAGLVQRDFLPDQLPNSEKVRCSKVFLPAEWVSGDIYDVVRVDENHIGFCLADVVGHGIPAALLTIFLKQTLVLKQTLENNYKIFSPAEVIKNLNVRMTAQRLSGYQFATCCYALLNTETFELIFSRAGHPHPILMRSGSEPRQLKIDGPLVGIFQEAEYVQKSVQLEPGDKVLLYSDGAEPIIGNFDEKKGFVFSKEFCEWKDLSITELADRFNNIAKNRTVDPSEFDDVTLIGFEIL